MANAATLVQDDFLLFTLAVPVVEPQRLLVPLLFQ